MRKNSAGNEVLPALLLLTIAFFIGTLVGCFLVGTVAGDGNDTLTVYLSHYLEAVRNGHIAAPSIPTLLWEILRWPVLTFLLGFTALGVLGVPVLFALRGFLLAFAIGSFVRMFGGGGCALAFVVFGVSGLLAMPVLFLFGVQGWQSSRKLLVKTAGERNKTALGRGVLVRYGVCAGILCVCILLERFVVPPLLLGATQLFSALT